MGFVTDAEPSSPASAHNVSGCRARSFEQLGVAAALPGVCAHLNDVGLRLSLQEV